MAPQPPVNAGSVVKGASVAGCPLFPEDNQWRRDISADPVDPRSDAYIASISTPDSGSFLHADFGSNPNYGIPFVAVPKDQSKVPIRYTDYGDESDKGPFPIPLNAPREAGSDRHVIAVKKGTCKLYELFNARRTSKGWAASSGAKFDLKSNALRPAGWTSADAAGLPILPGLARRSETKAGAILHALRFTAPSTQAGYVDPARHLASDDTNPDLPPMGLRVRLKSDYDISGFTGHSRVILESLKVYGMMLADNGSSWYISGQTDTGWNDDDLNQLKSVPGGAFEAVQHGTIHD
ncbi:MAG: hypothetical protein WD826_09340 [Actinomycetota bacterium]